MKIVIAGAGAVGTHLAELLSREDQDIILIDEDPERTAELSNSGEFDLMTLNVAPTSINGLKEAGVPHADLFIGVTPEETRNITCCMLAHALGCRKTVARVDNAEYTRPEYKDFFQQMGIDSIIYPECLAAQEILDGIKRPGVRQYWEVHGGALVMMGIKLRETARVLDKPLRELCGPETPYHVVAIKRGESTIIPGGSDSLIQGDIAYFMTLRKHVQHILQITGKEDYGEVRHMMIMGGGLTALHVIQDKPDSVSVKVIERDEERCRQFADMLDDPDISIIQGDGRDTSMLAEEGLRDMQAFAALTPYTETNILACLAAKRMGVRKTIALVENMDYVSLAEKLDIGTIINKKTIAASHIYQMMLDTDVSNVKCLTIANADVAEFMAGEGSLVTEKPVRDLRLPRGVTLGGLVRDGVGQLIYGNTQIQAGDSVVAFCLSGLIKNMDRYFCRPTSVISRVMSTLSN
mgnify:CR=1 FL=1